MTRVSLYCVPLRSFINGSVNIRLAGWEDSPSFEGKLMTILDMNCSPGQINQLFVNQKIIILNALICYFLGKDIIFKC